MQKSKLKKQKNVADRKLFYLTLVLTVLGLVVVANASSPAALSNFSDRFYYVKQQAVWGLIGLGALLVASKIPYLFWKKGYKIKYAPKSEVYILNNYDWKIWKSNHDNTWSLLSPIFLLLFLIIYCQQSSI